VEIRDGSVVNRAVKRDSIDLEDQIGPIRDACNDALAAFQQVFWKVCPSSVSLRVEKAGDSAKGLTWVVQWPTVDGKDSTIGIGEVDICLEERTYGCQGAPDVATGLSTRYETGCLDAQT